VRAIRLATVGPAGGHAPPAMVDALERELRRIFRLPSERHPGSIDVEAAWNPGRGQYYSTEILGRLVEATPADVRMLGVTGLDLYVPVLTFVFGEAQLEGNCALVSFHRLREEFYGLPPNEKLLAERLVKEAVHELGHTFGLRHCDNWRCVMASSHGVELLDVKGAEFCPACARVVRGEGVGPRGAFHSG
jgi:archaemetzincin